MLTNKQSKRLRSLAIKKYREYHRQFIVEGEKMVEELLTINSDILEIYAVTSWLEEKSQLLSKNLKTFEVSSNELKSISQQKTPNKVLAVLSIPEETDFPAPTGKKMLIADNLQDPGNFGTIIRTCDWFGIKNIICSKNTVDQYNPKVIQSTMGSFYRVKIWYTVLSDYLKKYKKEVPVYGAFMEGENAFKHNFPENAMLVVGNESKGISDKVKQHITNRITIPPKLSHDGLKPESLNASVAASILIAIMQI